MKLLIAVIALAVLGGIAVSVPNYFGSRIESKVRDLVALTKDSESIVLKVNQYDRGWFSSTLEIGVQSVAVEAWPGLVITQKVRHGPWIWSDKCDGMALGLGQGDLSSVEPGPATSVYFPDGPFLSTQTCVSMSGEFTGQAVVPGYDGPALSSQTGEPNLATRLVWSDTRLDWTYSTISNHISLLISAPKLRETDKSGNRTEIDSLTINVAVAPGTNELIEGELAISAERLHTIRGADVVTVDDLSFEFRNELDDATMDFIIGLSYRGMFAGGISLGEAHLNLVLEDLGIEGVVGMRDRIQVMDDYGGDANWGQLLAQFSPELLAHSPKFAIRRLEQSMGSGTSTITGFVQYNAESPSTQFSDRIIIDLKAAVPRDIVKGVFEYMTRRQLETRLASGGRSLGARDRATYIASQTNREIEKWDRSAFLVLDGDVYRSSAYVRNGVAAVNGQPETKYWTRMAEAIDAQMSR